MTPHTSRDYGDLEPELPKFQDTSIMNDTFDQISVTSLKDALFSVVRFDRLSANYQVQNNKTLSERMNILKSDETISL